MSINNIRKYESRFDYEVSGNDPLVTTNPPQVGDSWVNTTTGEIFVCIDATIDDNVWKGTQGNTIRGWIFEGGEYMLVIGGEPSNGVPHDLIQQFMFSSELNTTNINTLSVATYPAWTGKSQTRGYIGSIGGREGPYATNVVEYVLLATPETAVQAATTLTDGQSWSGQLNTESHIYVGCGISNGGTGNTSDSQRIIKYSVQGDTAETDLGDLLTGYTTTEWLASGASWEDTGLWLGGDDAIHTHQFSNDNVQFIGNTLTQYHELGNYSARSDTHAYVWGSYNHNNCSKVAKANQVVSANIFTGGYGYGGVGQTANSGYNPGGAANWSVTNNIWRVNFSNDTSATDIADLTVAAGNMSVISH